MRKLTYSFNVVCKFRFSQFFLLLERRRNTCVSQFFSSFLTDLKTLHKSPYWDNFLISFDPGRAPKAPINVNLQPDLIKKFS
jgi:hypothetical protein